MTIEQASGLETEIDRVRRSGVLGRSVLVLRLFDHLAERSLAGQAPKEAEVAIAVFGRRPDFDAGADAVVRVYVHKLRKRLEEAGAFEGAPLRLAVPRGEYRLAVDEPAVETAPRRAWRWGRPAFAAAAAALFAVVSLTAWAGASPPARHPVAGAAPWRAVIASDRPTLIVVGDYYIFGEFRDGARDRMVREYGVESPTDLAAFAAREPERAEGYFDLGLTYVPTGAAQALARLAPVLDAEGRPPRTIMASDLTPAMIKDNNLVYIGYLSGLRALREAVFAGSRFEVGETYDVLVDRRTGRRYASQAMEAVQNQGMYEDYGYVSTFAGPAGGRIVVIAGTRDAAVAQVAETVAERGGVDALWKAAGKTRDFEALYAIDGLGSLNVDGRLLLASALDQKAIWATRQRGHFPAG